MDISKFQPEDSISGDSLEDTQALKCMANSARDYLASFSWCPPIKNLFFAYGVGGIIAVFVAELTESIKDSNDSLLWVIEGDLPSAYMVADDIQDPKTAIEVYCDLMDEWAKTVIDNQNLEEVFPVKAEPTHENAELLLKRTKFIRETLVPGIK